jgi:transcriptional regulator with XRE-family HTH domain
MVDAGVKSYYKLFMDTAIRVIGQRMKEFRSKRELTLDEVAEKSGCTPGFLSQIERNKAVPSITTLHAIAETLGVTVADFFPGIINPTKVTRRESRESFHFEGSAISYCLLTTKFPYAGLAAFLMTIRPAQESLPTDEFRAHPGEEFYYMIEGVLRLYVGEEICDLYPSDSVYFRSESRHRLENRSGQPVVVLGLITPSIF